MKYRQPGLSYLVAWFTQSIPGILAEAAAPQKNMTTTSDKGPHRIEAEAQIEGARAQLRKAADKLRPKPKLIKVWTSGEKEMVRE